MVFLIFKGSAIVEEVGQEGVAAYGGLAGYITDVPLFLWSSAGIAVRKASRSRRSASRLRVQINAGRDSGPGIPGNQLATRGKDLICATFGDLARCAGDLIVHCSGQS